VWIQDNYCAVQDAFDFSVAEWEVIARGAIEGSWCLAERKSELTAMVDAVLQDEDIYY
jgi:adenosine deaminase